MLVLTRGLNETITIGDDIRVTVLTIGEGRVRIGVHAPKDVPVHRLEVWERIRKQKRESGEKQ